MKRPVVILLAFVVSLPLVARADVAYVDGLGREWLQPADTLGFTWFDVVPVCDVGTGVCAGTLGGIDLDGWRWANVATLNTLFHELSGGAGFFTAEPQEYEIANSTWAPALIDNDGPGPDTGVFHITALFGGVEERVFGWTRDKDPDPATGAYLGRIDNNPFFDKLQTDDRSDIDQENADIVGFWLYREPHPVPLPAGVWLLGAGLAGLAGFGRRHAR